MKDKDHVNILSDFFPKFLLKKLEKIGVEKPIFSDGGGNPPPLVLKGLNSTLPISCITESAADSWLFHFVYRM